MGLAYLLYRPIGVLGQRGQRHRQSHGVPFGPTAPEFRRLHVGFGTRPPFGSGPEDSSGDAGGCSMVMWRFYYVLFEFLPQNRSKSDGDGGIVAFEQTKVVWCNRQFAWRIFC